MSRQYRRKIQRQIEKYILRQSKRRRRTSGTRTLDFAQLEPRQLLAVVGTVLPSGVNLVENSEFENVDLSSGSLLDSSEVPNWNASLSTGGDLINIFDTDRAGHVLELDSTADQIDVVFQDIDTEFGENYVFAFDFRERDAGISADASSNDIEVFWDGDSVGVFSADTQWQTAVIRVEGGIADSTRLEFREIASGSDGIGGLIDKVRVVKVSDGSIGNGSFENLTEEGEIFSRDGSFILDADDVNVWRAAGESESAKQLQLVQGEQPSDGNRNLNLETAADRTDIVYQDVTTVEGAQYYLAFDLRADSSESTASNEFRVRWDNLWAGTFQGGAEWQSFGILVDASTDLSRLVFRETGSGTGSGPLVDNVRLFELDSSTGDPGEGTVVNDLSIDIDISESGNDGKASFSEGAGPTAIVNNGLVLSHESNDILTSATVRIENLLDGDAESLSVEAGDTGLNVIYDASIGRLGISGTASLAQYRAVLETLKYDNTSSTPATENRSISISITDREILEGDNFSRRAFIDVEINEQNTNPTIESIEDRTINFGASFSIQVVAEDAEDTQLSYEISTTGDIGLSAPTISETGRINWEAVVVDGGAVEFTVTVTDSGGGTAVEPFTVTVQEFVPFAGQRALSNIDPEFRDEIYTTAPAMTIDTNLDYVAVLKTSVGEIRLELFDDQAPITVNNFVNLAEDGFFDGLTFHRVISDFVAQGGDPLGTGTGGPGYTFQDEFDADLEFTGRGQLAMANSGPATNGSQFFITFAAQPHLTGVHTIFGELTSGDAALSQIAITGPDVEPTIIESVEIIFSSPDI